MKSEKLKTIEKLAKNLLVQLKIEARIEVVEDPENEAVRVQIETGDSGILIGYHGETLASLQLILGMMTQAELGEWTRVIVNVGDYQERRLESLRRMALTFAQKVKFSGEPVVLPPLSPAERRIIHLVLAENKEVVSESQGEGEERRLVIKPR